MIWEEGVISFILAQLLNSVHLHGFIPDIRVKGGSESLLSCTVSKWEPVHDLLAHACEFFLNEKTNQTMIITRKALTSKSEQRLFGGSSVCPHPMTRHCSIPLLAFSISPLSFESSSYFTSEVLLPLRSQTTTL